MPGVDPPDKLRRLQAVFRFREDVMWRWLLTVSLLLIMSGVSHPQVLPLQCVPNSSSTTFNASHDLHKVTIDGVKYPDMKPDMNIQDSAPLLNAAIAYVVSTNGGCTDLIVNPGAYFFNTAKSVPLHKAKTAYVYVPQAPSPVKINLRGSTLLFQESYYSAFYIDQCSGCAFESFSIDYVNLPFTQLNVTGVTSDGIAVTTQPNWPNLNQLYTHQTHVQGAADIKFLGFDTHDGVPQYAYTDWKLPTGGPAGTITLGTKPNPQTIIQTGDIFIAATRGGGPAIYQNAGSNTLFKDITIYTSGGPAIESWYSQTTSFIDIHVVPNKGRLVSTVAGGIQLNAMAGSGFVVRNCTIEATQDDSIAGNAEAPYAIAAMGRDELTVAGTPPQNPVFFMNGATGAAVGTPPSGPAHDLAPRALPFSYSVTPGLTWDQLTLLSNKAIIYGQTGFANGTGVAIQNNTITNSYLARGIGLSGVSKASITNNTITNTQQAGIMLGVDLPANVPTNNALIANNTLTNTNMGMSGVGPTYLGAIEVMAFAANGDVMAEQVSRHVFINGNTVNTTQRAGIWIGNVHGGAMNDNNVSGAGLSGGNLGIDDHLNNGLQPYTQEAFTSAVLAWCVVEVGVTGKGFDPLVTTLCPGSTSAK
jgi:hypothetical protein